MRLHKALRTYYRDQIDALQIGPGRFIIEKENSGRAGSRVFSLAFHAVLMALILTAMLSGLQRPTHLERQMDLVISRHDPGVWFTDTLERMIFVIKQYRNTGGDQ